jgi:ribosomal protein L11 methyltransferase
MKGVTYELSASFEVQNILAPEVVQTAMESIGIPADEIAETYGKEKAGLSYFTVRKEQAASLARRLVKQVPDNVRVTVKTLKDIDWQTKWKKDFHPFWLTERVRVVPLQMKDEVKLRPVNDIYVDSVMAFGTGMHPTTKAVAGFMERRRGKFSSFLDLGTGTGILSILAAKMGAREISAIDIDPEAVHTAERNLAANGITNVTPKAVELKKFRTKRQFDFVAANILVSVLVPCRGRIVSLARPGGFLAVSGIWKDDYARFLKEFPLRDLKRIAETEKKGWISILYRKR